MDPLTWTGSLSALNPVLFGLAALFALAVIVQIVSSLFLSDAAVAFGTDGVAIGPGGLYGASERAVRWLFLAIVALLVIYLVAGAILPRGPGGIIGAAARRFIPVGIALVVTFALSVTFKRKLGLYGKLFDSTIGMIGFAMVMFWVYTALFSDMIVANDVSSGTGIDVSVS